MNSCTVNPLTLLEQYYYKSTMSFPLVSFSLHGVNVSKKMHGVKPAKSSNVDQIKVRF
jgi:hypothetical protein